MALSLLALTALAAIGVQAGLPAAITDYKTIKSPNGVTIRYKEPGKAGVCETTPGVNSYSGYVDLAPDKHAFFWFFESRRDPKTDPVTVWLNGGPGSDSQIGLFQELGPCNVTADLKTQVNPYAWNEVSNMLFLSQPYGVGFSYQGSETRNGGRYPTVDGSKFGTTQLAAEAAYEIIQGFYDALPLLDNNVDMQDFNLWTESYGGHYGPGFFDYFTSQNNMIRSGAKKGHLLKMNTLGIGNGIISEYIQAPDYPRFAVNNTYGIKAYSDLTYRRVEAAVPQCQKMVQQCAAADRSTSAGQRTCASATNYCRNNVEGPYYQVSGRGTYDIRHPSNDPTPPQYFQDFLNLASTQKAIGTNFNYTESSSAIFSAFSATGDFVYPDLLTDLQRIIASGVRVNLYHGDADYICNWFGGESVSKAINYTGADAFRKSGYAPFVVDGVEYGEVRQHGNFNFMRIYDAGHEVPYYQGKASLAMFQRTLSGLDIATGTVKLTPDYSTSGEAQATHTQATPPPPPGLLQGLLGSLVPLPSVRPRSFIS